MSFRDAPGLDSNVIEYLPGGTEVKLNPHKETVDDGRYVWQSIIVVESNTRGWVSETKLSPYLHLPSVSPKYGIFPGAGETLSFSRLPFRVPFNTSSQSYWGFGDTRYSKEDPNSVYKSSKGHHPGIDHELVFGTKLYWEGNISGIIVSVHDGKFGYMYKEPYIVVEAGGFHTMYGHTSGVAVNPETNRPFEVGDSINPGDLIGYSGEDKHGFAHLHFEIRPSDPLPQEIEADPTDIASRYVINPLTFFSPELQSKWAPIFNGDPSWPDYPDADDDSLSMGYYSTR